jgi:hypothetical protein
VYLGNKEVKVLRRERIAWINWRDVQRYSDAQKSQEQSILSVSIRAHPWSNSSSENGLTLPAAESGFLTADGRG